MIPFSLTPEVLSVLTLLLCALVVLLCILVIRLELRMRRLAKGKNAQSLEDTITALVRGQKDTEDFFTELRDSLADMESRIARSVQAVETIRFNAFKGTGSGGDQSFATALLDEEGNGVILLGLFARERVSVFAKPVSAFSPRYELSNEEAEALERAKQALAKKPKTA